MRNSKRKREKRPRSNKKVQSTVDSGEDLASKEWLRQKQEEWHRPVAFPGSDEHTSDLIRSDLEGISLMSLVYKRVCRGPHRSNFCVRLRLRLQWRSQGGGL